MFSLGWVAQLKFLVRFPSSLYIVRFVCTLVLSVLNLLNMAWAGTICFISVEHWNRHLNLKLGQEKEFSVALKVPVRIYDIYRHCPWSYI